MGETLQAARERKGVDLYRAERDTKIRLRYLAALEDGDWDDLPAPVYTKGFLRNYAIYLGLEPDEILDRWRDEMEQLRTATRVAVAPPPMPLVEPGGRRFTLTPAMIVAGLVLLVIFAFAGYIGLQLMRFAQTTPVALTYPDNVVTRIDADHVTLSGTAGKGSLITITGPGGELYNTSADEAGVWQRDVPLARGENNFTIVATDPVTQRESDPLQLAITVPLPTPSPGATATSAAPIPLTVQLSAPSNGLVTSNGSITFSGYTSGTRITIDSTYLGAPGTTPAPSLPPLATPTPLSSGVPAATVPPVGPARDITITGGTFNETLQFPNGRWQVVVTTYASGLAPVAQTLELTVEPERTGSLQLVIDVVARKDWLRVTADGARPDGFTGGTKTQGESFTFTAQHEFCVRTGNAGGLRLTLNGQQMPPLGLHGQVGAWTINGVDQPQPAPNNCE